MSSITLTLLALVFFSVGSSTTTAQNLRGSDYYDFIVDYSGVGDGSSYEIVGNSWEYHAYSANIGGDVPAGLSKDLFQKHRSSRESLTYKIYGFEPNSVNEVSMGFAEVYQPNCELGRRVMDLKANGEYLAQDLDVWSQVGCENAYVVKKEAKANDMGQYEVTVTPKVENAMVTFVAVKRLSAGTDPTPSPTPPELDIRFNKFSHSDSELDFAPLGINDYPMRGSIAEYLKGNTEAWSIVTDGDPGLSAQSPSHYIDLIGGLPSMPSNGEAEFWNEFRQVLNTQINRRLGIAPLQSEFTPPALWGGMDVHGVAEAVHDEYPGSLQAELIQWLWQQKVPVDHDILPFRSKYDFIGYEVMMADLNTWAIGLVGPTNFFTKWFVGRPRPEEIAWKIRTGELTVDHGVPQDIVDGVQSMNIQRPEEFTAYEEGCPLHPSWPAMHSAASAASFWLAVVMDLSPSQYCEALRVDHAVSFARTVAGVHYASDNTAGLNLGQQVVAETLAHHLSVKYGSDRGTVQAKIDRLRHDWTTFDSATCQTNAAS